MGIRVVPNETVPATVYKHLLPHERQVITVRFHPAVLIRPVAEVLAGLAIAGLLSTTLARHKRPRAAGHLADLALGRAQAAL